MTSPLRYCCAFAPRFSLRRRQTGYAYRYFLDRHVAVIPLFAVDNLAGETRRHFGPRWRCFFLLDFRFVYQQLGWRTREFLLRVFLAVEIEDKISDDYRKVDFQ